MKHIPDAILSDVLDLLEGSESIESILAQFPEQAIELRSFLETDLQLRQLPTKSSPEARQVSKKEFLIQAATLQPLQADKGRTPQSIWPRLLLPAASLAVLVVMFASIFISASASALPGDTLYGTKRSIEHWRLLLARSPEAASDLEEAFLQERIHEIKLLLDRDRSSDISFEAIIMDISDQQWLVGGLPLVIDEATVIVGTPLIGAKAQVDGHTRDSRLYADQITIIAGEEQVPEPIIIPTTTPTMTPSAMPSSTAIIFSPTTMPTKMPPALPSPTAAIVTPMPPDDFDDDDEEGEDDDEEPEDPDDTEEPDEPEDPDDTEEPDDTDDPEEPDDPDDD